MLPQPVRSESRICFGVSYFATEADAATYAAYVRSRGQTYNGGYFHGAPCGREPSRDFIDPVHGQLFAVTG